MNIVNDEVIFDDADYLRFSPRAQKALTIFANPVQHLSNVVNATIRSALDRATVTQLAKADKATFDQVESLLDSLPVKGLPAPAEVVGETPKT